MIMFIQPPSWKPLVAAPVTHDLFIHTASCLQKLYHCLHPLCQPPPCRLRGSRTVALKPADALDSLRQRPFHQHYIHLWLKWPFASWRLFQKWTSHCPHIRMGWRPEKAKNDWVQRKLPEKWQKQKAEVMTDMGLAAVWWHSSTASVSILPIHATMFEWHNDVAVYSIVFNFIDYYISFQQSSKYTNMTYLISQCKSLRWHLHKTRDVKKQQCQSDGRMKFNKPLKTEQ